MASGNNTVVAKIGLDDKGFQEGVSKIQRSLKVVQSEFAAASTKLGDYGKSTEGLKLKQDNLNKQIDLHKQKVAALNKSYEDSVEKKGEDAKATENLKIKLNYAQAELNKMETELINVNRELEVQSSGWTKMGTSFDSIGGKMKTLGSGFSNVGKTLSMSVTAPIVAAGTGLVKLASDFEGATNIIRIGTGATGESLKGLEQDFKAVYTSVNTNISDASQVIADLNTRTGLSGESLQTLSTQMLRLAKITGEDINTLIPAATRMFQDAGIGAEDYGDALDYTFKVSQSTGIGVSRLQELMTQFGGPLRQMGFDWQTAAAMLGKFEKEGVNTNLVLGSLRIALGKMAKEGISEPNEALQIMIQRIKDAGTAGEANALALEMFGAKAGPDMAAAIREGRLDLDELIESIKVSPETIEQAAKDTETVADKFMVLKNQIAVALEPVGTKLIEAVEKAMPSIQRLIEGVVGIVEKFAALSPGQQDMIIKFALLAAAIGPVVSIIGSVISVGGTLFTAFGAISTAIGAASTATGVLGTVFTVLTGPIGIIGAAIAGLVTVFVTLYNTNQGFRTAVQNIWESIKNGVITIIEGIKQAFTFFIEFGKKVWSEYGDDLINIVSIAFNGIKSGIENVIGLIKNIIDIWINLFTGNWKGAFEGIKTYTSNIWNYLKSIITTTLDVINKLVPGSVDKIKATISNVWDSIKTITANVWEKIKSLIINPIISAKDAVKGAIDSILGFFKNLKLPEIKIPKIKLPHFSLEGDFSLMPPKVPTLSVNWYAKGGIFNDPSVIGVGEAGKEAVLPIDRLDDLMAKAIQKAGAVNPTAAGLVVKIENFINNTDKDIEQLAYELEFYRQRVSFAKGGA